MTLRHCRVCDGWHDLDKPWPRNCIGHFGERKNRSSLPAPMIIKDGMDPVQSMLTMDWYDSKSALRREYRRHDVIELGNETIKPRPDDDRADIADMERSVAQACEQIGF